MAKAKIKAKKHSVRLDLTKDEAETLRDILSTTNYSIGVDTGMLGVYKALHPIVGMRAKSIKYRIEKVV